MAKFLPWAEFGPSSSSDLQLLPLRFERLDANRYLVANLVGDALLLSTGELGRIAALDLKPGVRAGGGARWPSQHRARAGEAAKTWPKTDR
jgi:hypothetical protein